MKNKIFAAVILFAIILHFRFRLWTIVMILLFFLYGPRRIHCMKKSISEIHRRIMTEFLFLCEPFQSYLLSVKQHIYMYESNKLILIWTSEILCCCDFAQPSRIGPFFHSPLLRPLMTAQVDAGLPHKRLIIKQSFSRVLLSI